MQHRMLVFSGERDVSTLLAQHLLGRGYEVVEHFEHDAALAAAETPFDAVVINLGIDRSPALLLANSLMARSQAPLVLFVSHRTTEALSSAIAAGVFDVIASRAPSPPARVGASFDQLLGGSPPMQRLFGVVSQVAGTDSTVLITGESGTGKELIARALHQHSPRASGRFVPINCGALTPTLFESELFGHVRGAFTDARADRKGAFRDADGGTLFLDEVGEIPFEFQARLLRVLQERAGRPVGADFEQPFNARIVVATRRDLWREVQAKRFREDLYFRLNVVHIDAPPLRARGSDITLLAQHFIGLAAKRADKVVSGLSPELAQVLQAMPWPGNVRELQNVIERAVVMTSNAVLGTHDVQAVAPAVVEAAPVVPFTAEPLQSVERRHVLAVIEVMGGNHTRAAKALGIDRVTLYRKLKSWGEADAK